MSSVRSMNGINNIEVNNIEFPDGSTISSANNLVQLDTNNNFTGNNTYNTNLPTSIIDPLVGDIANNTMLNRFSADKLYSTTDTNDYITGFSRNGATGKITLTQTNTGDPIGTVDVTNITDTQLTAIGNAVLKTDVIQTIDGQKTFVVFPKMELTDATPPAVPVPTDDAELITKQYVDTTAVLKTTAQEINGEKTFVDFPKMKLTDATPPTVPVPTDDAELTTKSYVDTTAVLKTTAQEIGGTKTFVDFPEIKLTDAVPPEVPDPTANNQFATKKYVDDNGGTGDAVLDGGTTGTQQDFTGFNLFSNYTEFRDILLKNTAVNTNSTFNMESAVSNQFIQKSTYVDPNASGGKTNIIYQFGGIANSINQGASPLGNLILQNSSNSVIQTEGTIRVGATPVTIPNNYAQGNTQSPPYNTQIRGGIYVDGASGLRIPRRGLYDRTGEREWRIDHFSGGSTQQSGVNCLVFYFSSTIGANGNFLARMRLQSNGRLELDANLLTQQNFSDARLKTNNKYLENATESLLKLSVQTYDKASVNNFNLNEPTGETVRETGLIAQEVYYNAPEFRGLISAGREYNDEFDLSGNQIGDGKAEGTEIIPDEMDLSGVPIGEDPDYEGAGWSKTERASIEYQGFIAYLIKSNQELHERILKLEEKINM